MKLFISKIYYLHNSTSLLKTLYKRTKNRLCRVIWSSFAANTVYLSWFFSLLFLFLIIIFPMDYPRVREGEAAVWVSRFSLTLRYIKTCLSEIGRTLKIRGIVCEVLVMLYFLKTSILVICDPLWWLHLTTNVRLFKSQPCAFEWIGTIPFWLPNGL